MTGSELQKRVYARLDDDPEAPAGITPKEVLDGLNEAQELASLLTLCFESTTALTISAASAFLDLRPILPDFLAPLALRVGGSRIQPATLADLDALNDAWQATAGAPERYAVLGFNFLAVTPQGTTDTAAQLTYARTPVPIVLDQALEIDDEYQPVLVDYCLWRVSLKEGARALERGKGYLQNYLEAMQQLAGVVRARSRTARYDVLPLELQLFDKRNNPK